MPVIAIASSKGGSGKSTTTIVLAGEYAAAGYKVHIIDADKGGRVHSWGSQGTTPAEISVSRANEETLRQEVEAAKKSAEVVLIDVEGSANAALALAIGYADGVLVTSNHSAWDVEDAFKTVRLIRDIEGMSKRQIPHGVVWSKVNTAIRSREIDALEAQVAQGGVGIVGQLFDRTAFKSIVSFSTTLHLLNEADVPGLAKAKADAGALAEAVGALVSSGKVAKTEIAA